MQMELDEAIRLFDRLTTQYQWTYHDRAEEIVEVGYNLINSWHFQ
jgi:hypothetical protein